MKTDQVETKLRMVCFAATPEEHAFTLAGLLEELANDAEQAGAECDEAWNEKTAGGPWRKRARELRQVAQRFAKQGRPRA